MTNDTFFAALEACKDQFVWTVNPMGWIRATHPQHPDTFFCPWTALALQQGSLFSLDKYWRAAWLVGRTAYPHATRLADIADSIYRNDDPDAATLRARFETCLGLKEGTP